jgi:TolB-like protein/Flp pilus assembly protein TadD
MAEHGESENHPGPTDDATAFSAHVFLSYASDDAEVAQKVCSSVEAAGLRCWMAPRDVKPGAQYADAIVRAINDAKIVVLVMSASAVDSAHVAREIERAASKRKPIIPFRIDTAALNPELEYFLSNSQWIEVPKLGLPAALAKLKEAVGQRPVPSPRAAPGHRLGGSASRRTIIATAVVIALGVAVGLGLYFWKANHGGGQAPAVTAISDKSIAVLPFVDMSEKKDQEYFADGMAEEILDLLAKIPGLKVIGRTSSFQFKGKTQDLRAIGMQLGVAYVLEGSVRKVGDRLRVTAQLINSKDGTHLWSQTYDRDLSDVLKMQDEIAGQIARALQIEVSAGDLVSRPALRNTQAYTLYLQATHASDRYDRQGWEQIMSDLQRALELDPSFAEAASALAGTYYWAGSVGFVELSVAIEQTRHFAELALKLDPNLVEPRALLGVIQGTYEWNWSAAERELKRALALAPNNTDILQNLASLSLSLGRGDDALKYMNASLAVDPLDPSGYFWLSIVQLRRGRLPDAEAAIRRAIEMSPTSIFNHYIFGCVLLARDQLKPALAEFLKDLSDGARIEGSAMAYFALGRKRDSDAALAQAVKSYASSPAGIAVVYAFRVESDEAFKWLDRAYAQKDPLLNGIKYRSEFDNLHGDPRYKALLKKMNLPE